MLTNLRIELEKIDERWIELDTLSSIAKKYSNEEDGEEYKALCRSTTVLICSHLEGALRAVSRAYIRDLNDYASFRNAPNALKRTYITDVLLIQSEKEKINQNAVNRLVNALSETNFKMDENSLFTVNKNPSINIVDRFYRIFKGEKKSLFPVLASSRLTVVFEDDQTKTRRLLTDVRKSCLHGSENYPYTMTNHYFEDESTPESDLFEHFLEDVLRRRNDIVHGNTLSNGIGIRTIDEYIVKAKLLLYGYILAICQ